MKLFTFLLISAFSFVVACTAPYKQMIKNYEQRDQDSVPNYQDLYFWAAHPNKIDPSDSVPAPLRTNHRVDTSVDVFFIHPTTYTDDQKPYGFNAPIQNNDLNAKTDYTTILFQASAFNHIGQIFAPRYRQANLQSYFPKNASDSTAAMAAFELAYTDIKNAFMHYLKHYNHGRPIVIAAHSQGTTHGKRLLKELFDGTPLQKQLVAAYLIGIPVTASAYTNLKACANPTATGCIVSWRTYKAGYTPPLIQAESFKAIVTNPLTWDDSKPNADRSLNKGGVLLKFNKIVPAVASANIEGNILWTPKPKFFGNIFYTTNNYHVGDINLYYLNIRENVAARVHAFKQP